jgi:response regulator RpfG family c-di-GMP phosphodiesterase
MLLAEYWKPLATPEVLRAIRHQRERFDGLGYPTGLAGEEIPLLARILGLAGTVVALHQPRPFRPARSLVDIRSEIEQAVGRHFDPNLARIMLQLIDVGQLSFLE